MLDVFFALLFVLSPVSPVHLADPFYPPIGHLLEPFVELGFDGLFGRAHNVGQAVGEVELPQEWAHEHDLDIEGRPASDASVGLGVECELAAFPLADVLLPLRASASHLCGGFVPCYLASTAKMSSRAKPLVDNCRAPRKPLR